MTIDKPLVRTASALIIHITNDDKTYVLFHLHPKLLKWMGPGGKIEPHELVHEALEREVLEETGLIIKFMTHQYTSRALGLPTPVAITRHEDEVIVEDYVYEYEVYKMDPVLEPFMWLPIDEALKLDMYKDTEEQLIHIKHALAFTARPLDIFCPDI